MERIQKRFDELAERLKRIRTRMKSQVDQQTSDTILEWHASAQAFLHQVFGPDHVTTKTFDDKWATKFVETMNSRDEDICRINYVAPIFMSAKEQFEGGFLFEIRSLIHADVFDDELDQAKYFAKDGWKIPALVIAGTVLESSLRELCDQNGISITRPTINPMNDELAKAGIYNKAMKTKVLNWAQNRNSAAHGKKTELDALSDDDVKRMIDGIGDFVAKHMN